MFMVWKGEELVTIKDFLMKGINRCESQAEAQEFMKMYRDENPFADFNLGFMSCYYSPDDIQRIYTWFGVESKVSALKSQVFVPQAGAEYRSKSLYPDIIDFVDRENPGASV
jgi:hypothetical protein